MRRSLVYAAVLPVLALCAGRAEAQVVTTSSGGAVVPTVASARAACVMRAFGAAGYRTQMHPSDSTRRVLVRSLVGVDLNTGLLSPTNSRTEMVEVQLDDSPAGLSITGVTLLNPNVAAPNAGRRQEQPTASERYRAAEQARELLSAVEPRCAK